MTAEPPSVKQLLAHDETIINPYYMRQLLEYGIILGKEGKSTALSSEALLREAEVRPMLWIRESHVDVDELFLAFGRGTKIYGICGRLVAKCTPLVSIPAFSSHPSVSYAFLHASPMSQAL
jgi:hypothetical protein